jgi:hypothetical protein
MSDTAQEDEQSNRYVAPVDKPAAQFIDAALTVIGELKI